MYFVQCCLNKVCYKCTLYNVCFTKCVINVLCTINRIDLSSFTSEVVQRFPTQSPFNCMISIMTYQRHHATYIHLNIIKRIHMSIQERLPTITRLIMMLMSVDAHKFTDIYSNDFDDDRDESCGNIVSNI